MTTLTNYVFNMRHNKLAKDSASQATAPPTESNLIGPIMTYVNSLSLDPVSAISVSSADFEAGVTTAITGAGGSSESVSSYISRAISNYNTAAAAAATTARYTVRYFAIKSSYVAANAVGGGSLGLTICPLVYNLLSDGTAIPTSDAFSLAITNLVTNAGGNTTQANSAIADVRTAIYTTPFAPSPPPPAPTTYNVMGISGSGTEPAVSSVLRTAAVAATSGAQPLSQTLISLINSFTYGYTDLIQSNISNIELELYDATIYSGGITSLATAVKDAVTTAATSYYSPAVSPSFIFKVASSALAGIDYTVPLTSINPIINATPSFSGLSNSVVDNGDGTTTITWTWTEFTDDGSTTDGLKIANNANFLLNIASLEITSFGGIQLSRASTLAFENFKGSITSSTLPTIATNTNFTSLFKVTDGTTNIPSINFGNIGSWNVSTVINMSHMFDQCHSFNQGLSSWTTTAVTTMANMFNGASAFNQSAIASSFIFTQITDFTDFIRNTGFTTAGYSQFLINLQNNTTLPSGLNIGTTGLSRYANSLTNAAYTYLTTTKSLSWATSDTLIQPIPCFLEGTKIQCLDKNTNTDVYVPIQTLKSGDLVKTYKHGYVALKLIGWRDIVNSGDAERSKERLYKCTSEKYPELFEDLFITGSHSILVDSFTQEQQTQNIKIFDKIFITDDKYRLPACIDDRAVPYDKAGTFPIYHIALENDNYYMNYGVYANGLLVETCSLRYLQELSNMTLI